jgi:hypothetical protein
MLPVAPPGSCPGRLMTPAPIQPSRLFVLVRHRDPSGVSGTGVVAVGDVLAGGVSDIQAVHGHDGATEVRYLDDPIPGPARAATPGPGRR